MPMTQKKSKTRAKKNKYALELTGKSLFLAILGLIFLLAWIFVLGILVGRGLIPDSMKSVAELKEEISMLQARLSGNKTDQGAISKQKNPEEEQKFEFFQKLATKKKETAITLPHQKSSRQKPKHNITKATGIGPRAYTVQLASLDKSESASKLVRKLVALGYPAYYYKVSVKGKIYYRVRCGKFNTEQEARSLMLSLKQKARLNGFVCKLD